MLFRSHYLVTTLSLSLSALLRRHGGSQWWQQSTYMCQSTNLVKRGGIFWIDFRSTNPNMVTQIEVDLKLHTLTISRLILVWTIPKR